MTHQLLTSAVHSEGVARYVEEGWGKKLKSEAEKLMIFQQASCFPSELFRYESHSWTDQVLTRECSKYVKLVLTLLQGCPAQLHFQTFHLFSEVPRRPLQPLGCWSTLSDFLFLFFTSMGVGDNSWREKQDLFICLKPKKIGLRPTSTSSRLSLWSLELQLLPLQPCSVTKNNFWTKPNQRMLLQSCDCHEETESFYSVKYSEEKLWPFHVPAFALQVCSGLKKQAPGTVLILDWGQVEEHETEESQHQWATISGLDEWIRI